MAEEAAVVVIGSGGFGSSTAYHLAKRGTRNVVLLDRYEIGSQTSPRAAGLSSKVASTEVMVRLVNEAVETLAGFEQATGRSVRFQRSGAMRVVLTEEGEARIRRDSDLARSLGVPVEELSPAEAERLAPWFRAGSARLITFSPGDGYFHPPLVAVGLAAAAADFGVSVRPHTLVERVLVEQGRVAGVRTSQGEIRAPVVVDAAGAWSRQLAELIGLRVPLIPTRHQLFITEPLPSVEPHHPVVRIHEPSVYVRPEEGGLLLGGYEDGPLQLDLARQRADFQISELSLDLTVLRDLSEEVAQHFPSIQGAPLREHRGGLPTMSPDGRHIVGPVRELPGFYLASACNVGGLSISPAVGRALADLILDGRCEPDLSLFSIERFRGVYDAEAELSAACAVAYSRKYTRA